MSIVALVWFAVILVALVVVAYIGFLLIDWLASQAQFPAQLTTALKLILGLIVFVAFVWDILYLFGQVPGPSIAITR